MTDVNIFLMILDIVGLLILIRRIKKNLFKRRYKLSDRRVYYLILISIVLISFGPVFNMTGLLNFQSI
jgi:hypothetical protein